MLSFKLFRISFKVSYPAVALLTISVLSSGFDSLLFLCLLAAALHESGHILFIFLYTGRPRGISLRLGDVAIDCNFDNIPLKKEMIITTAGIVSNIIMGLLSILFYCVFTKTFFRDFAICNFVLGIFNSLPIKSLDGGQILWLLLSQRLSLKKADLIINIISITIIIPVLVLGIMLLFVSKYNYSLLLVSIYLVTIISTKEMR